MVNTDLGVLSVYIINMSAEVSFDTIWETSHCSQEGVGGKKRRKDKREKVIPALDACILDHHLESLLFH